MWSLIYIICNVDENVQLLNIFKILEPIWNETRLPKDNGPASEEPNETHNEYILHFHKFHKVL